MVHRLQSAINSQQMLCLFPAKPVQRLFIKFFSILQENNCLLLFYRKLIQYISKKVVLNRFYVELQLLPAIRQYSGEFIGQQDCPSAQGKVVLRH